MVQLYKRKGGEILVNTATLNSQSGGNIALLPGGGFVIVWVDGSMTGADTSGFAVRGQRFDAAGNPAGGEFLINSIVTGNQTGAIVATLASGRFVVTWTDASATGGDTSGVAVRGQIFEADGTPVGLEFLINTETNGNQGPPAITELSGGGFVVTWADSSGVGGDASGTAVKAQVFSAAGAPVGTEFLVNMTTAGSQGASGLSTIGLAGGGFAILYSTTAAVGGEAQSTLWVQRFDAAGVKVGGEEVVNGDPLGNLFGLNLSALNAGFIVAWGQQDSLQSPGIPITYDLHAQMFDAAGARLGPEFIVNTTRAGTQSNPDVDRLPGGGFLVTWQGPTVSSTDFDIYGQFFDDDGVRVGDEFIVNTFPGNNQTGARIEVLPSGDIVIIWTDNSGQGGDASGSSVKMQILTLSTGAPTDIALSNTQITEVAVENLAIATLSAFNAGALNSDFTYEIVSDSSGGAFRIEGDQLIVGDNGRLDFETQPEVTLRIRVTDLNGTSYEETLSIAVADSPTEIRYAAGDEFLVNADTGGFNVPVAMAALASGGFAIVTSWTEIGVGDGYRLQIFDAAGAPAGAERDLDLMERGGSGIVVAGLPSGGFVIVYEGGSIDLGPGTNGFPIRAQLFDAAGNEIGADLLVSQTNGGILGDPEVTLLSAGGFVISWTLPLHEDGSDGGPFPSQIKARIYDGAGTALGDEFRVNSGIEYSQGNSHVAALPGGGFVVAWEEYDGAATRIEAQIFDAAGARIGGELVLQSVSLNATNELIDYRLTALASGSVLFSWVQRFAEDPDVYDVRARILAPDGTIGAMTFLVNATLDPSHEIAALPGGGFVLSGVAVDALDPALDDYHLFALPFDAAGVRIGEGFEVPDPLPGAEEIPHLAVLASGDIAFAWARSIIEDFAVTNDVYGRVLTLQQDAINGTPGPDTLIGTAGDDVINGLAGNDVLIGGGGADTLAGGADNDVYRVETADDVVIEAIGQGADAVYAVNSYALGAGSEVELLSAIDPGSAVAMNLTGNEYANLIIGTAGSNTLIGGGGADILIGGGGNDVYRIEEAGDVVVENFGGGFDAIYAVNSYALAAGSEIELLSAIAPAVAVAMNLTGNEIANILVGTAGGNVLIGGGGADTLIGGGGNDVYRVEEAGDIVFESIGGGFDAVYAVVSYTLAAGSEVELLSAIDPASTAGMNLTGNEYANLIYGNAAANTLIGGGGADVLIGGAGGDFYRVEEMSDVVVEAAGGGADSVYAVGSYALAAGSEVELLSAIDPASTAAMDLTGNEFANSIYGNAGSNTLIGGGGADTLFGGAGNDYYRVEEAGDAVVEAVGGGSDAVYAVTSYTLAAGAEIEILSAIDPGSTGAMNLTGNEFNNFIYGTAGANTLNGGRGLDGLWGLGGADDFLFNTALGSSNWDTIVDFVSGTDRILLDNDVFVGIGPPGALGNGAFSTSGANGPAACILYAVGLGWLSFDADGSGPGAPVLFASLMPGDAVTHLDFVVV